MIGCCVTLVEALRAAEKLAADGVNIRIIDPFTLKPLDKETIIASARATGGKIITVEDHYEWGRCLSLKGCLCDSNAVLKFLNKFLNMNDTVFFRIYVPLFI